jgi:sugar O-acyltransferase (sialic acid O-acetyltransferase NeuD family)
MRKLAIFGAGGFGRDVMMVIDQINAQERKWEMIGFYDDGKEKGEIINDYPILGGIEELNNIAYPLGIVIALGNPLIKRKIHRFINNSQIFYPTLIHPNVIMGNRKFLSIGEGCIIGPGNILTVNIKVGNHVFLSVFCSVGHDTIINDYASFMPGVNISGDVLVKECVYVGTGTKIVNRIEIGSETFIGAGSVVSKSLPGKCTAVGIPARPIKFNH